MPAWGDEKCNCIRTTFGVCECLSVGCHRRVVTGGFVVFFWPSIGKQPRTQPRPRLNGSLPRAFAAQNELRRRFSTLALGLWFASLFGGSSKHGLVFGGRLRLAA